MPNLLGLASFALLALAIIAAGILAQHWARARSQLTQRIAELTAIEQVSRAIAGAQFDVDELCQLLYEHVSRVADASVFHIGLFEGDAYDLRLWIQEGHRQPAQTLQLTPGVGLVNWLRESRKPILVRDLEQEIDQLPARPLYLSDRPPRSALFAPLIAGETVTGTMSVQSYRPHAYGDSDLRVLVAMASQAALAMQKAQLYTQERKRTRQLETVGRVSRQVAATLALDELFRETVRLIRESFGYYHVGIFTADRERQSVTFQASASAGHQDVVFGVAWGEGLIGWVAAYVQSVIVNDVANDARYRCVEALDETRSEMAVPLKLENEVVGVLDVQSDRLQAFGPDDLFILETLGDQVAIAIQEARLYQAEQQQAWFATALLQVAEASSRLSDMDDVLTTITRLTPLLAGVDRCAILLWDSDTESFILARVHGLVPELRETLEQMRFRQGSFPALDLLRRDRSALIVNAQRDSLLIPPHLSSTFNIQEMVLHPLLAQGELLGAMLVDYAGTPHTFDERTIEMLAGIANQAAMVIQSARLLQTQKEEAYISVALLQVAEAVSRSAGLEEALASIARITPLLVGVEACALFVWDASDAAFVPAQQYGLDRNAESVFWQMHLSLADFPAQELFADKSAVALEELPYPLRCSFGEWRGRAEAVSRDGDSLLILPITIRSDIVGLMSVTCSGAVRRSSQRWMSILAGIASQAAIAVETDRLQQEAAVKERMKQELEVARRIQSSFLPECCPQVEGWELAAVWRSAREVAGDFYDFIPLPPEAGRGSTDSPESSRPPRMGIAIADVADKGVPAALFMALSRTLMRTMAITGLPPARAIAQANDLILADARADLFVTLFYAILDQGSGSLLYSNAGHVPPLLIHAADGVTQELRTSGMAMGVLPGITYEERSANLEPGDLIVMYTDGVVEASNAQHELFGRQRLAQVAREHRAASAAELVAIIEKAVGTFVGNSPQSDDLTVVVVKRHVPSA